MLSSSRISVESLVLFISSGSDFLSLSDTLRSLLLVLFSHRWIYLFDLSVDFVIARWLLEESIYVIRVSSAP